jgi:hypothetical protein
MEEGWTWRFHLHSIRKGDVEKIQETPQIYSQKRQWIKQRKTGMLTGTWNVRTLFRIGSLLMFTHQFILFSNGGCKCVCACVRMCGFCNVCVCVGFVMCVFVSVL